MEGQIINEVYDLRDLIYLMLCLMEIIIARTNRLANIHNVTRKSYIQYTHFKAFVLFK